LELTEKNSILQTEKEVLIKKFTEEKAENSNEKFNEKLEKYEMNFQDLIAEKSLFEEKIRILQEKLVSNEKNNDKEKALFKEKNEKIHDNLMNKYKQELKNIVKLQYFLNFIELFY